MKKETLAKLNYVLDSMQLSKEHKAALTDVFNDVSSSGGGVEKFVFEFIINDDPNSPFLNINNKYTTSFPDTSAFEIANIYVPNDIFNYIKNHLGDYVIFTAPDLGFTSQLFGCTGNGDIYYNILTAENNSPTIIPYIRFIPE